LGSELVRLEAVEIPVDESAEVPGEAYAEAFTETPAEIIAEVPPEVSPSSRSMVFDTSVFISFNVNRPYQSPALKTTFTERSVSGTASTPAPVGIIDENATESPKRTEPAPITTTDDIADDSSDGTVVVEQGGSPALEMEGVRRRWFREEMHQSAVHPLFCS
jgi:hypothetical protein